MRKSVLLLFVFTLFVSVNSLTAQSIKRCGTMEYLSRQLAEDPDLQTRMDAIESFTRDQEQNAAAMRTSSTVITIPVIFHVLYFNSAQNISTARILDQLATLNKDYAHLNADSNNTPVPFRPMAANTNIQFCLAQQDPSGNYTTGIIRKQVSVTGFDPLSNDNIKFSSLGGDDAWDRNFYLNIWIANFTGISAGIIGISQFPGGAAATDGCVVYYGTVGGETYHGTTQNYNLGRTLTHEVGHWLNLRHIWGDDGGTCSGSDYVADTPNQAFENYQCVAFPHVSCNNGPNGDMFMNYMDYGDDDCLNMFTAGQGTRMTSALNGPRQAIKNSTKCEDLTGISAAQALAGFSVYPNPSNGEMVISGRMNGRSVVKISVVNTLGETVFSEDYENIEDLEQQIDLSGRQNGIYFIEVRSSIGVSTQKMVLYR